MAELNKMKSEKCRIDAQKFWQLNKKIFPRSRDPPTSIYDKKGNIITADKAIEERVIEVYSERLNPNNIKPSLKTHEKNINKLCESRLKLTRNNKSEPWIMEDLDRALKDLGDNKSIDALGHIIELYKRGVAGTDLKLATLKLMNLIKDHQKYPDAFKPCNITSIYKHKGSHKDMNNYRGVFRVSVL